VNYNILAAIASMSLWVDMTWHPPLERQKCPVLRKLMKGLEDRV
jgi:hypothetical protein